MSIGDMSTANDLNVYCSIDNVCYIKCQSQSACSNMLLHCFGTCYVRCNQSNGSVDCPVASSSTTYFIWQTESPTSQPSEIPTNSPTDVPTNLPTTIPTTLPTTLPTTVPSAAPSNYPSTIPTTLPTTSPAVPSNYPTSVPSVNHSDISTPTINPQGVPAGNASNWTPTTSGTVDSNSNTEAAQVNQVGVYLWQFWLCLEVFIFTNTKQKEAIFMM